MFAILIIQSDKAAGVELQDWLRQEGYKADICSTGLAGLLQLQKYEYDVLIIDSQLSDNSGIDLCRRVTSSNLSLPVLVLGNQSSSEETVQALDAGAQDYVAKPIPHMEISARIRSLLRRYANQGIPRAMMPVIPPGVQNTPFRAG